MRLLAAVSCLFLTLLVTVDEPQQPADQKSPDKTAQRDALAPFQAFVGEWRGVGQPRRGSAKDAWPEEGHWAWQFRDQTAALTWESPNGKYVQRAQLQAMPVDPSATPSSGWFELTARGADGTELRYRGRTNDQGHLVLESAQAPDSSPARISLRTVANGDRLLVLYEQRLDGDRFTRLAEVGMTRKGSGFGQGTSFVECVVTGGAGTIPVMFEGQTYYVCCTGCRDYFQDNAAEVLAEYRQRKEAEKHKPKR